MTRDQKSQHSTKNASQEPMRMVDAESDDLSLLYFPREFRKGMLERFDRRFLVILALSFVTHFTVMGYYVVNPPSRKVTQEQIQRVQQRFARLVLKKDVPLVPERLEPAPEVLEGSSESEADKAEAVEEKPETEAKKPAAKKPKTTRRKRAGSTETRTAPAEQRRRGQAAGAAARKRSQQQIAQAVSNKGLLGLLTGSGSAASGEAVRDVLGDLKGGAGSNNLDEVLSGLGGLKTQGKSGAGKGGGGGRSVRGDRATGGGGIDDLVTDLGNAKSKDLGRQGGISAGEMEFVGEGGSAKGDKSGRDSDAISQVVQSHNSAIEYCYQRELKRNPGLRGRVTVRFTITADGRVKDVKILNSTLRNKKVERCIVSRVRRWDDFGRVPSGKQTATIRQVYTFGY